MPETDTHREDIFLRKLMNKANIGWWEADVKTECYKCSGFIAQLLGLDEEGIISFNDRFKRIKNFRCCLMEFGLAGIFLNKFS